MYLSLSILAGVLLGILFFGGLWWTVQIMTGSSKPYLLFTVSFLVRTTVLLSAFYLLLSGGWPFMLAALTGFLLARIGMFNRLKP